LVLLHVQAALLHAPSELIVVVLTCAAANQLAHARQQQVGSRNLISDQTSKKQQKKVK
jgi:hypothetical protein